MVFWYEVGLGPTFLVGGGCSRGPPVFDGGDGGGFAWFHPVLGLGLGLG